MSAQHAIDAASSNAPAITYGGASAAVMFWGLHISDIAVILSAFASICGVFLQGYVAIHRIRRLERQAEHSKRVTTALAEGVRVLDETKQPKNYGDN